jgi:large subunit ribosomal protein L6
MAKAYRPILIPSGVDVKAQGDKVSVKGKLGALLIPVHAGVAVKIEAGAFRVEGDGEVERAHVGTVRAHIANAITGVTAGYVKTLEVRGMGYRVQKTKDGVQIECGYSHPVLMTAPAGVTFEVSQAPDPDDSKIQMSVITASGIDRQVVGEIAAEIRAIKPPDNYLGKGIRYRGERVVKKAGKRAAGTQA